SKQERIAHLVERVLESPAAAAAALHPRVDAFANDPALLTLMRRLADTPAIQEARRAALEAGTLSPTLLSEAALLALGRGDRGEKAPFARALLERADGSALETLVAARVVELSHAPAEAARIRAELPPEGGVALTSARLALRGGDAALAEALASAALDCHPGSITAARTLEAAAMEADSPETLAVAE